MGCALALDQRTRQACRLKACDASDRHYDLELSRITRTIADEGGLNSVCWSGVRKRGEDGRLRLSVKFDRLKYSIEVGYPAPLEAAFSGEPMIKSESIEAVQGKRTVLLMERKNSLVSVRSESGAWRSHRDAVLPSEPALAGFFDGVLADEVEQSCGYAGFRKILTSSPCTYSFPHTTSPVTSASPGVLMSLTVPPASRTISIPAAMSQDCKLRSQ